MNAFPITKAFALIFSLAVFADLPAGMASGIDFEAASGYQLETDMSSFQGWKSSPGLGRISAADAKEGTQSLEILSSDNNEAIVEKIAFPKKGIVFVDFWIRPVADVSSDPESTLDIHGAVLGFVKNAEQGSVVAVSPADSAAVETNYEFPVDDQNVAEEWIRMTIRQDLDAKKWDLFLDGRLVLIDQPLGGSPSKKAAALAFYPAKTAPTFVDDISVDVKNPLFADSDQDGIPDAVEEANGTNPYYNDRDIDSNGDSHSNIKNLLQGRSMTTAAAGNRRYVYIDNSVGSDTDSGELSYRVSGKGPKKSLRGAAQKLAGGDVVFVLLPSDKPYICPDYPPGQAPDVSYVLLGNATLTGE